MLVKHTLAWKLLTPPNIKSAGERWVILLDVKRCHPTNHVRFLSGPLVISYRTTMGLRTVVYEYLSKRIPLVHLVKLSSIEPMPEK